MFNPYEVDKSTLVLFDTVSVSSLPPGVAVGGPTGPNASLNATHSNKSQVTISDDTLQGLTADEALAKLFPPTDAGVDAEGNPKARVCSTENVDRMGVIHLQDRIDKRCLELEARSIGVDPIREDIYAQALNEIIRQVTVMCPERGLLLAELRDEVQETNDTYDLLFDSACQYATRKAIERDLKRTMATQLHELTSQVRTLENRVHELHAKYSGIDKRFNEQRAAEEKVHQEEVQFLKKGNLQLTTEIKRLSA